VTPATFLGFVLLAARGGACRNTMCGGSATACAACATAIMPGRSTSMRPCGISAPGSRAPTTRTPGGCARRSSATRCFTRRGGLTGPLPRRPRRLLEQQPTEPARGEPQRQRARQPEQQYRLLACQDTPPAGAGVFTETPGAQGCVQDRS
jgi:hypothetical protein